MKRFQEDKLTITFDGITMDWFGKSIFQNPSERLDPFFNEILAENSRKKIIIRFNHLEYISSSTIQSILKLFRTLNEKNIETTVLYDENSEWQSSAFSAFEILKTVMKNLIINPG